MRCHTENLFLSTYTDLELSFQLCVLSKNLQGVSLLHLFGIRYFLLLKMFSCLDRG